MTEKKKKILHLLASNKFSGAENVACTIIRNMSDDFDMVYCSPRGPIEKKLKEMGIRYIGIDKLNRKNLKRVVDKYKPDIIHAHDYRASLVASGFNKRCKIISHIHKNDPRMNKISLKSLYYFFILHRIEIIVGVSDAILNECIIKNFVQDKYLTIPNYVDKSEILKKAHEFKIDKTYDLFFFGRLCSEKNPIGFLKIVKEINDEKIKCIMIGDGPLRDECEKYIMDNGLGNKVDMVGFKNNPYPYIWASNIGVMPSRYEGYGITAIESTILGKPVLNSGVGGLGCIFSGTNLVAGSDIDDYIKLFKTNNKKLPDIDRYCDYDSWHQSMMNIYHLNVFGLNKEEY